jgi:hypothetical protein
VLNNGFSWVSYFSFFTILSNVSSCLLLLAGAWPWTPSAQESTALDFARGAAVVYMVITGIIYALLLSQYEVIGPAWINDVEHRVMPVVIAVDWLLMPPARRIGLGRAMWWLVIPVVYLTYSEIRGPFVHWYPYPFLDPGPHGVLHVVVSCIGVAVGVVVVAVAVAAIGDYLSGRRRAAGGQRLLRSRREQIREQIREQRREPARGPGR